MAIERNIMQRVALWAAVVVGLVPAGAQADQAVHLQAVDARVSIPGGWSYELDGETDVLRRGAGPKLVLMFEKPNPSFDCPAFIEGFAARSGSARIVESPQYLPGGGVYRRVVEDALTNGAGRASTFCVPTVEGAAIGNAVYAGAVNDVRLEEIRPIVARVTTALSVGLANSLGPPGPRPASPVSPAAPVPTGQRVHLDKPNIDITLPSGWRTEVADGRQLLVRVQGPELRVHIGETYAGRSCDTYFDRSRSSGAAVSSAPSWVPSTWHRSMVQDTERSEIEGMTLCAQRAGGATPAFVAVAKPAAAARLEELSAVLEEVSRGLGLTPSPSPGPSPAPSGDDDDDWDDEHEDGGVLALELAVLSVAPESDVLEGSLGATLGLGYSRGIVGFSIFGLGVFGHARIGHAFSGNWLGDAQLGMRLGMRLGPVNLAPIGGVGVDGIGGADDDITYKVPTDGYGFYGGRLFVGFENFGLSGEFQRAHRFDDELVTPIEHRIDAGLTYFTDATGYAGLFRFVHYDTGVGLGGAFRIDVSL